MTKTLTKIISLAATIVVALPAGQALAAPKAKAQFSQAAYAVAENGGSATITVVRPRNGHSTKRLGQSMTVHYSTADGTAKAGVDYSATSGTLSFPACGSTITAGDPCVSQTFQVAVIDNSLVDGPRTLSLKLSNPLSSTGRAILGYPSTAALVIADDDVPAGGPAPSTFQFALPPGAATDVVSESAGTETVFIVRSGDLSQATSVNYATADGSAKAGTDYTATSGTANFASAAGDPVGSIIQAVSIPLLHNPASDPQTADFSVSLSLPGGSTDLLGSPSTETVTIVNSDGTPTLLWSAPAYSVAENSSDPVRLTVIAAGAVPADGEADVDYATADGSALDGVNYVAQGDTLQFFAGDVAESFDVPVIDDGTPGDKYFTAGLSNAVGGSIGTPSTATVNVLDVDGSPANDGSGGGSGSGGTTPTSSDSSSASAGGDQGGQIVLGARQSACGLVVKAAKKQRLLRKKALVLKLRSGAGCKVSLAATIKQLRAKKHRKAGHAARALRFNAKKVSLSLQPGKAKTVKVRFTKKTLKAIKKALRARKRLVATVVVTERAAGSAPAKKRTLKVTIRR